MWLTDPRALPEYSNMMWSEMRGLMVSLLFVAPGCNGAANAPTLDGAVGPRMDAGDPVSVPPLDVSNGLELMAGVDPRQRTLLDGSCELDTRNGSISCNGLVVRLNKAGVDGGIGWEVHAPTAAMCAGSEMAAPSVAVFSFGSLEIPAGAELYVTGPHAVAFLAADTIQVGGVVHPRPIFPDGVGGFLAQFWEPPEAGAPLFGPASGETVSGEDPRGAGGAGGQTLGGNGGNAGGAGGAALVPQFEPLCGGSSGGTVGHYTPETGGVIYGGGGGHGGAAVLFAAGNSIAFDGPFGCGLHANGGYGSGGTDRGGAGGGAGGTISIEAPSVTLAGECKVTAIGGAGGSSSTGALGGAAGDGTTAPETGADGDYGAGGGGSAGFIRVRTASCAGTWTGIKPSPTCEPL